MTSLIWWLSSDPSLVGTASETSLGPLPMILLIACQLCSLAYLDINFYANFEYACPKEGGIVIWT